MIGDPRPSHRPRYMPQSFKLSFSVRNWLHTDLDESETRDRRDKDVERIPLTDKASNEVVDLGAAVSVAFVYSDCDIPNVCSSSTRSAAVPVCCSTTWKELRDRIQNKFHGHEGTECVSGYWTNQPEEKC